MELGFGQKSENRSAKSFRTRLPAKGQKIIINARMYNCRLHCRLLCLRRELIKRVLVSFSRQCYFRIQRALSGPGKFLEDLNTTYGSGVLTCDYEGQEFKAFLKWLMKNYFR